MYFSLKYVIFCYYETCKKSKASPKPWKVGGWLWLRLGNFNGRFLVLNIFQCLIKRREDWRLFAFKGHAVCKRCAADDGKGERGGYTQSDCGKRRYGFHKNNSLKNLYIDTMTGVILRSKRYSFSIIF